MMIQKIALAVILPVLALSFAACGLGPVTEGEVTDKIFTEAHTEQQEIMEQECERESYYTGTGSKRKKQYRTECEEVGTGEYEDVEYPAKWEFELTNDEGDTGTVEVDEDTYNNTDIGDFYKDE